jgi:hypothetical protein
MLNSLKTRHNRPPKKSLTKQSPYPVINPRADRLFCSIHSTSSNSTPSEHVVCAAGQSLTSSPLMLWANLGSKGGLHAVR